MSDETEIRLADIQASVHRIEGTVGVMQARQDRADARMTELERDVIEVRAEQRGAEKVMTSEHARLHEKIDTFNKNLTDEITDVKKSLSAGIADIGKTLRDHTVKEDADRTKLLVAGWVIAASLLAYLGKAFFERFIVGV